MRKHDVRKWLHAILDLLPVIIIPVFMVYSHRHTIDTYAITTPKYETITMQQNIINGKPTSLDNWEDIDGYNYYYYLLDGYVNVDFEGENGSQSDFYYVQENIEFGLNDKILISFDDKVIDLLGTCEVYFSTNDNDYLIVTYDDVQFVAERVQHIFTIDYAASSSKFLDIFCTLSSDFNFSIKNFQLFNLTEMFGSGNEPTIDEFNALFPNEYYPVDNTASVLIQNGTQTYNDIDIGSQMFYCLYNSVDKYFNMGNVFGLNNVYRWFEINIFHSAAPLSMYIVWNIVLYEFVMDLLFLLYGLFMWFIDIVENIMNKPFKSIK